MSTKDQIRAEIEREMGEITYGVGEPKDVYTFCGELLAFIKSLPEQPVEGLEEKDFVEEVRQYYSNNCTWDALKQPMLSVITRCARHFAEWGAEHLKR